MDGHRIAHVRVSRGSVAEEENTSETENPTDTESVDSMLDINHTNASEEAVTEADTPPVTDDNNKPENSTEDAATPGNGKQAAHATQESPAVNDKLIAASSHDDTAAHTDPGRK